MWEFVDFLEVASLENAIPHEREYIVAQLLRSSVGPPMGNVTERVESLSGTSRDEIIYAVAAAASRPAGRLSCRRAVRLPTPKNGF